MLRSLILAVASVAALAACGPPEPLPWNDADGHRWRELRVPARGAPGFTSQSARRSGIDFQNVLARESAMERDHLLVGSGVALGDVDGDGLLDVFFAGLESPNALYRNLGDLRFEDVSDAAGIRGEGRPSTGAAFADVDGDGDLDLFVASLGGPDGLFLNDGTGRFTDVAEEAGVASEAGSTTAAFADIDGDGDLDLYVARYKVESAADILRPYEQASVELVVEEDGVRRIGDAYAEHFRLEMRNGVEVAAEQADPDRLYLNRGDGTFEPVPWTEGRFLDADGQPLSRDLDDFGLAARFYDVDQDGDPDLYVCNDFDDPDQLWLNDGSGTFRAAAPTALRTTSHASMAVDFADIDRDGAVDFFVADMLSSDPARRLAQVPLHAELEKPAGRILDRPQVGRNTLFWGRGDGSWAQIAEMAGVDGSEWTWGSLFLDVDLDGYEDLLVVNGHGRDMRDGDALERIRSLRGSVTWNEAKSLYPDLPTRNRAFRNRGDLTFEDVGEEWSFGEEPDVAHGIASGDLDGDGDLDIVLNRLNANALVLRNDAVAPRVAVRLVGAGGNRQGIGAQVRLLGGTVLDQARQITAGGLYLSGAEAAVTFAAGAGPMTIEVEWPDGATSRIPAQADRLYEIHRERAEPAGAADSGPASSSRPADGVEAPTLFEDVSPLLGGVHVEDAFADFARQPLLPYRLSRLGPGLTWTDLDGDGRTDLVVPSGLGGETLVLFNRPAGFVSEGVAPAAHDHLSALPDPRRPRTLLVSRTSYDAASPDQARTLSGVVRVGEGGAPEPVAPGHLSSSGALAQADVNGDGELDLFVAGRTVPAFYPLPATSRLFVGENGDYRPVDLPGLTDLGLVSGATFTDLDDDGDPDLALAVEWGPVRVFENRSGDFVDVTAEYGVSGMTGLWRGVAAGDFDGDGRMDLVATNLGLSTRWATSAERPLTLVHADVDQSGTWDLGIGRAREAGGPLHPLERYERMRPALPGLIRRVDAFDAYGAATMEEVLGRPLDQLFRLDATTLEHTVFLNRGGRFEAAPLPVEAQIAPAHGVVVADFDGDGNEDVVLAQNFFPTDPYTPRYDAGRSVLLLGDGAGGFTSMPAAVSGIDVPGDARGAAVGDFDGDGRADLAVAQNGSAVKLYRNRGGAPGVTVRLVGRTPNPAAIGSRVRLLYPDGPGPVREIRSGSGYASADDPVVVLGMRGVPRAIEIRWPDGTVTEEPLSPGVLDILARHPSTR